MKILLNVKYQNKQASLIAKYFKLFNFNHVQNKQKSDISKSKHSDYKSECSFRPKVSNYSSHLAQKLRANNYTGNYKFYEIMTEKIKKTNEWKFEQKMMKDNEQMKECTFQPEIHSGRLANYTSNYTMMRSQYSLLYGKSTER